MDYLPIFTTVAAPRPEEVPDLLRDGKFVQVRTDHNGPTITLMQMDDTFEANVSDGSIFSDAKGKVYGFETAELAIENALFYLNNPDTNHGPNGELHLHPHLTVPRRDTE